MEEGKAYIQKNPLLGRKVISIDRLRDSVWDWQLLDATVVSIDKVPTVHRLQGAPSSLYDHQGLEEIPLRTFNKILAMAKLLTSMQAVVDEQKSVVLRQETMGQIIDLLTTEGIIDDETYSAAQLRRYSEEYDRYTRQQMEQVTDVIDVHK